MTMKDILPLKELAEGLQDRKLRTVAERTGLSYPTLLRIANGKHTNFNIKTLQKVSDYLNSNRYGAWPVIVPESPIWAGIDWAAPERVKADYLKILTDFVMPLDVDDMADAVARTGVHHDVIARIVSSAGSRTTRGLSQDGRQRAYFELALLGVGAKLTYERVRLQGLPDPDVPDHKLKGVSYAELRELEQCCLDVGCTATTIKAVIVEAGRLSGSNARTIEDQDQRGMAIVYDNLVSTLVNKKLLL